MKHLLFVLCALLVSVSFAFALGNTCANPIEVAIPADLTYHSGGLTTCGLGNDYGNFGCVPSGYGNGEDAVFRLTVASRTRIRVVLNTYTPTPRPALVIFDACPPAGQCIARAYSATSWVETVITLNPGQYFVIVDNWPGPNCLSTFGLNIFALPLDPGEDCSEAISITGSLPQTVSGSTCGFDDNLDAACTTVSTAPDVVYSYTSAAGAQVTFDLCQSNYDTKIFIYDGSCLGTPIACNDDGGVPCGDNPFRSYLGCVPLIAGHEYFIVIDGSGTACENYALTMTECAPPPGDICANAIPIPSELPQTVTGNSCSYQNDYDGYCGVGSLAPDVVYTYIPAADGYINLDPCDSPYHVALWVWDGCLGNVVGCLTYGGGAGNECSISHLSLRCVPVQAGHMYFIVVDGWNSECGDYTLSITSCLPGEIHTNAIPILGLLPQTVTGSTCGYLNDADACFTYSVSGDVFYSYMSPADQTVTFDMCGSSYDTRFFIYSSIGEGCNDDDPLHCPNPTRSYIQCLPLRANTEYWIVVDGSYGQCGNYVLSMSRCYSDRPCDVCTPPDVTLASIPESACGASISGNCGWQGKWVAEFQGTAGMNYHWDLCPDAPCNGTANFDPDIKICDANCQILAGSDGDCLIGQYMVPNDFVWTCTTTGTYYVIIAPWQSYNMHNCPGSAANEFTMVYYSEPVRPCASCTPADANLGDITTTECGGSISGNLGHDGKWAAEFQGLAGATYHWDLCPTDPCAGHSEEGSNPSDVDIVIFDSNCSFVESYDGEEWCDWRPNDYQWVCPANGIYYVLIAPWPRGMQEPISSTVPGIPKSPSRSCITAGLRRSCPASAVMMRHSCPPICRNRCQVIPVRTAMIGTPTACKGRISAARMSPMRMLRPLTCS